MDRRRRKKRNKNREMWKNEEKRNE